MATIMQGDAYNIPIKLTTSSGTVVANSDVDDVEIILGPYRMTYASNGVQWDEGNQAWLFPMSQEMSMSFGSSVQCQARVKFSGGDVIGVALENISVAKSQSRTVL